MAKTISAVLIVKNEESCLEACLESVKEADEIIVCDTGSIDNTIEIAKRYTDKVYTDFIWCDDFSKAQNHAKSKATGDFILSIDADEQLTCPFQNVRDAVELATNFVRVKMIAKGSIKSDFGFSRLFRNSPEIFWVQPIHKHLNLPGEGEPVGDVSITYGYSPSHAYDPNRSLRILEKAVEDEGEEACRNLFYLGREYWYKQRYEECTAMLGRYVQKDFWNAQKAEAFLIMARCYSHRGLDEDARDANLQAIKINPNFKEAVKFMADISTPENAEQWRRMARTCSNRDVLFVREETEEINKKTIAICPHNDDEILFLGYSLIRLKPTTIIVTDSFLQPERGDVGCDAETRRKESISACSMLGCPVVFLGIRDTELTEDILKERLSGLSADTFYIPAIHHNGNPQHNLISKVCQELFPREKIEQYCTYSASDLMVKGNYEIIPTPEEIALKNKAIDCYASQINLPSMKYHIEYIRNKPEWLI